MMPYNLIYKPFRTVRFLLPWEGLEELSDRLEGS